MYKILNISKAGLNAMQNKVDGIADDLANSNTDGYKRKEISFQELLTNEVYDSDVLKSENLGHSRINTGVKSGVGTTNFQQGIILPSTGDFHMALEGEGFFGVRDANGNLLLTRNGGFHINQNFTISDDNGYALDMDPYLPFEQWGSGPVAISDNGDITKIIDGEDILVGKVILHKPHVLDSLIPMGEGRYLQSPNGELYSSRIQEGGFGRIVQHSLEGSNVEMAKSMTDLIATQRGYSLNGRVLQSTDDIISMINNIKR